MFNFLDSKKRKIILSFPFVKSFLQRSITLKIFLSDLDAFRQKLAELGFSNEEIESIMANAVLYDKKEKLYLLWGQHRMSEPLSLHIKDLLLTDGEIVNNVGFIEYRLYKYDDYISVLLKKKQAITKGISPRKLELVFSQRAKRYEELLRGKYGDYIFNFHDGKDIIGDDIDITFRIPSYIKDSEKLGNIISLTGKKHQLKTNLIYMGHNKPRFRIEDENNITVEFIQHDAKSMLYYENEVIRNLVSEFIGNPDDMLLAKEYMDLNRKNPYFLKTAKIYSSFMKDLLLAIGTYP